MSSKPFDRHCVYKGLETDAEFLARVRERAPGTYITFERKVKRKGWYGVDYTDTEQDIARVADLAGERLDDVAWLALKMQRRIVERSTER